MRADPSPSRRARLAAQWRRAAPYVFAASTLALGVALTWFLATHGRWPVAAGIGILTPVAAGVELWGALRAGDAEEWPVVRVSYVIVVIVVSVVYAATTGREFYAVSMPALVFLPATVQGGRLAGAWRERRLRERGDRPPPTA